MKKLLITATLLLTLSSSAIAANSYIIPEPTAQGTQTEQIQVEQTLIQDNQFYYITVTVTKCEYDTEQEQYLTTLIAENGNEFIIYTDNHITGSNLNCTVDSNYTEGINDDEIVNVEFVEGE